MLNFVKGFSVLLFGIISTGIFLALVFGGLFMLFQDERLGALLVVSGFVFMYCVVQVFTS